MLATFDIRLNISLCYCDVNEIRIVYIVLLSVIHLFYRSNSAEIKKYKNETNKKRLHNFIIANYST